MCIPTSVPDNAAEETFCKTVGKVGVKIGNRYIESWQSVGNQDRTSLTQAQERLEIVNES